MKNECLSSKQIKNEDGETSLHPFLPQKGQRSLQGQSPILFLDSKNCGYDDCDL